MRRRRLPGGTVARALVLTISALAACRPQSTPPSHPVASASVTEATVAPPASPAAPAPAPEAEPRENGLVARMLRRVEIARQIEATKPVPGVLLERPALIARVKEHVARELPPEAIRNEGLALQLFGFIPTQFDYEAAEYQLLQDQLAGYYEPADGTMYMASDLGDQEAEATLAHE